MALLVIACGGGRTPPAHPAPENPDAGAAADGAPSEAECDALLDHTIALAVDQRPEPKPSQDDRLKLRVQLRDQMMQPCRAMARTVYRCAIDAATIAALTACDQASRSNSTSNSNVAPGGIKPPAAPRSP